MLVPARLTHTYRGDPVSNETVLKLLQYYFDTIVKLLRNYRETHGTLLRHNCDFVLQLFSTIQVILSTLIHRGYSPPCITGQVAQ